MTNKKEIFDKIIIYMKSVKVNGDVYAPVKHTIRDEFESYSFETGFYRYNLTEAKEICKKGKWKTECGVELWKVYINPDTKTSLTGSTPTIVNQYTTILYNNVKDKISVSEFRVGYDYSYKKNRYYPVRKNTPILCLSKHFYVFNTPKKTNKLQVRHWKGQHPSSIYVEHMINIILGIEFTERIPVLTKYYRNANSIFEVIERVLDCKIPKALRGFDYQDVFKLTKGLTNKNELNTICQYLSKNPSIANKGIYNVVALITIGKDKVWLIRDYFDDLNSLGKTTSLNIKSLKRIEDSHRKMSIERMLLNTPEITVAKPFVKFSENFKITHELIADKNRLLAESYDQHHCVGTRADTINQKICGILCVHYNNLRYTLDIRIDQKNYYIYEFRGLLNCNPPKELVDLVQDEIQRINKLFNESEEFQNIHKKSTPVLELW